MVTFHGKFPRKASFFPNGNFSSINSDAFHDENQQRCKWVFFPWTFLAAFPIKASCVPNGIFPWKFGPLFLRKAMCIPNVYFFIENLGRFSWAMSAATKSCYWVSIIPNVGETTIFFFHDVLPLRLRLCVCVCVCVCVCARARACVCLSGCLSLCVRVCHSAHFCV